MFKTVTEAWGMRCPKCKCDDKIDIAAFIWVRLSTDGTDPDEADNTDHEWDDSHRARCGACEHMGTVGEFGMTAFNGV